MLAKCRNRLHFTNYKNTTVQFAQKATIQSDRASVLTTSTTFALHTQQKSSPTRLNTADSGA